MDLIRKILPSVSHAFLALILLMLANNIFFYHEHSLDNGETIRHAHPFLSEEDEQQRDHTESELILLDLVTHAQYFLPDRVNLVERVPEIHLSEKIEFVALSPDFECSTVVSLRGPPSIFC